MKKPENLEYLNKPYGRTRAGDCIRFIADYWLNRVTEWAQPELTGPIEVLHQRQLPPSGHVRILPLPNGVIEMPVNQPATPAPVTEDRPHLYLVR